MSTGADCSFTEVAAGEWYYALQCWPYGEHPDYDVFGPFPTQDVADQHLSDNHANPGGYSVLAFDPERPPAPETVDRIRKDAVKPAPARRW